MVFTRINISGLRSAVGYVSEIDVRLTADPGVASVIPARSSHLLIHSRRVVVSFKLNK